MKAIIAVLTLSCVAASAQTTPDPRSLAAFQTWPVHDQMVYIMGQTDGDNNVCTGKYDYVNVASRVIADVNLVVQAEPALGKKSRQETIQVTLETDFPCKAAK